MGWLLAGFLAVVLPGCWFAWWLTGDDYRGVHRCAHVDGRHRVPDLDPDGPTITMRGRFYRTY